MNKNTLSLLLVGLCILSGIVAGFAYYLWPATPLIWKIGWGVSAAALVGYFGTQFQFINQTLHKKTAQFGLISIVMAVVGIGVVVLINVIVCEYADVKKDLTKNKLHTLSDQSQKILKNLEKPVSFLVFANPMEKQNYEQFLEKYSNYSKQVKVEFMDPDKDPTVGEKYNIRRWGVIVVESGPESTKIDNLAGGVEDPKAEEKITNAIIQVMKGKKRKLYFVTGHKEQALSKNLSSMKETLSSSRYDVEELLLIEQKEIPKDADAVVIAGPKTNFMEHELGALKTFLNSGGRLLLMVDPDSSPDLQGLLAEYGAHWAPREAIVETQPHPMLGPFVPLVTDFDSSHDITKDLGGAMGLFPVATPVTRLEKLPEGRRVQNLFSTRPTTAETQLSERQGKMVIDPKKLGKPEAKPLALALSGDVKKTEDKKVEKPADGQEEKEKKPEYRFVVVGDSDFATNNASRNGVNSDLFRNMLSWLVEEEDLISIRPKPTDESRLEVTQARMAAIFWISVLFAPLALLISGFSISMIRKRK